MSGFRIRNTARILRSGGIVAYPTEAVWGIGCDPLNGGAIMRLLEMKQRSAGKGLILIAADVAQLQPYIQTLDKQRMREVSRTWPGAVTWLFPAAKDVPWWLTGGQERIAVRVTRHKLAAELCEATGGPLVSTSANLSGHPPARNALQVRLQFRDRLDAILCGATDGYDRPTPIFDARTGQQVRA